MTALLETVRVRNGAAPLWALHHARLARSAAALGLAVPADLAAPAGGADRAWRLELGAAGPVVTERPVGSLDPVRLITSSVQHAGYPHKTTDRAPFGAALAMALTAGVDDAVLVTSGGFVTETAIWTLFWWEDDRLWAPPLELGILPSVARARIEAMAGPVAVRAVRPAQLRGRALVVANAVRGPVAVAALDGEMCPAHLGTADLAARFWP